MNHLYPRLHIRPPHGYVNDPNGPIETGGRLHLYYQYRPSLSGAAPVEWGHASSSDFVHWKHHRAGLTPVPDGLDAGGCWSGNTILDPQGRVVAFYSGCKSGKPYESVLRAVSDDGGFSFGEPELAVVDPGPEEGIRAFRDPFVWAEDDRWLMAVGAGSHHEVASVRLYTSTDLYTWEHVGPLLELPRGQADGVDTGWMWECPQVIDLDGRRLVLVATMVPGRTFGDILILTVPEPGRGNAPLSVQRLDAGADLYAASALRDSPYGPLVWGWVHEARHSSWSIEDGWSGMLSLPRVLSLGDDGRVLVQPLPALTSLRGTPLDVDTSIDTARATTTESIFEVRCTLAADEQRLQLTVNFGAQETLTLTADRSTASLTLDNTHASLDPRVEPTPVTIPDTTLQQGKNYHFTVYVDGSVLELFTDSGISATMRLYPTTPPPWQLQMTDGTLAGWHLMP